jgi:hypothetical protein
VPQDGAAAQSHHPIMRGRASLATDSAGWRGSEALEPIREASEFLSGCSGGAGTGQVLDNFVSIHIILLHRRLHPGRFFRVNIRSKSERGGSCKETAGQVRAHNASVSAIPGISRSSGHGTRARRP